MRASGGLLHQRLLHLILLFHHLHRASPTSPADHDLLGRLYAEFDSFGGVNVRLAAADSDIAITTTTSSGPPPPPPLEAARRRVHGGGKLPDDPTTPAELSLSLTDDPTEMRVRWATQAQDLGNPRVEASCAPGTDDVSTFAAAASTYTVPQKWWPIFNGSLYDAVVTGIPLRASCTYRVGSDAAFSPWESFEAAPAPEDPTSVAVWADQGTFMPLGFAVTEKLIAVQDNLVPDAASAPRRVSMVVHVGDLSYAGIDTAFPRLNVSKDDEFEHVWDLWQSQNQPVAATRPYMVGIGNHEAWYNWTSVTSRFTMPRGASSGAVPPFWYSMDHGFAHWVMLCSEFPVDEGSPQGQWLRRDLAWANEQSEAAAAASSATEGLSSPRRRPWIIVTIHRPLYSSDQSWIGLRATLEPLLEEYRVDLVLSGHMHAYERTHAVGQNGSAVVLPSADSGAPSSSSDGSGCEHVDEYRDVPPGMPVYVTQGNAGAIQLERWQRPSPEWSAVRWANGRAESWRDDGTTTSSKEWSYSDSFGFGVVSFLNSSAMTYESIPITGSFCDKFVLARPVPEGMV